MIYKKRFRFPPGVTVQQDMEGFIYFTYESAAVPLMRDALKTLRGEILDDSILEARKQKDLELQNHQLPLTRAQELDKEIAALEAQRSA